MAAGDSVVAAEWVMRGTNDGPFLGAPPTNKAVALPGADVMTIDGERIRSVKGYFDQRTLVEQLGLQAIVQPYSLGPVRFGTCAYMNAGSRKKPAAFSLTTIHLRTPAEQAETDERGAAIVEELAGAPGFVSTALTTIGHFGHTITAWENAEAPRQFLRSSAHKAAMGRFFSGDLAAGGMTSVWIPVRMSAWARCADCGEMVNVEQRAHDRCRCGAAAPAPLPYW